MKQIIDFLAQLRDNNNREWFNAHKTEYLECKAQFDAFVEQLIDGIRRFDPSIGPLSPADCTYRIYRDTRFSQDKRPYKIHMGAFICPRGKRSDFSGYYFQMGPGASEYDDGSFLATGNYYCETPVLRLLREDIALDEGREFAAALDAAEGFSLDWDNALKKVPTGFDADKPYSQWLRLRNFCLVKPINRRYVTSPRLLDNLLADFRTTTPFLSFVNRAVDFHLGENSN